MATSDSASEEEAPKVELQTPRPLTERFQTSVAKIRTLPKEGPYMADNTTKLRFYALYKQATEGPCRTSQPGFWDLVGKAKWEAWHVCGNMSREIAMQLYVEELTELVKAMPQTDESEDFLKSICPFYEAENVEEEEGDEDGGEGDGEGGEDVTGEGQTPLSSSVLHHIDEMDSPGVGSSRKRDGGGEGEGEEGGEGEREEEGEGEREEEGEGEREEEGEGEREEEGEGSSIGSDDFLESFQELQTDQTTTTELSSPWQIISPGSASTSFEFDPKHKTPHTKSPPEDPLPPHTVRTPSGNFQRGSEFRGPVRPDLVGGETDRPTPQTNATRTGTEDQQLRDRQRAGSPHETVSAAPLVVTHSRVLRPQTGEGTLGQGQHSLSSERRGNSGPHLELGAVSSQVALLQERVQDIVHQLSSLSQTVQGIVQQYYGPGSSEASQPVPSARSRGTPRQRRARQIVHLSLLLLGWPLLAHAITTYLLKNSHTVPFWVLSAVSAVQILLSIILNYGGFPL